ncbi:MAG: YczE/YyaS/YitT family protein [Acidimicrobiales bacterium]
MNDALRRLVQIVVGLYVFGAGLAFTVIGGFGQGAWTVFHEGISDHTPLTIGGATVLTGTVVFIVVLVMKVPVGRGTILNVLLIGPSTDLTLWLIDSPDHWVGRAAFTISGPLVVAFGSSLYLGVHWGPGPRDGLMLGLNERGVSIRSGRFGVEATAFTAGFLLGGTIGWGTVWSLVAIGPAVQWMLPWFDRAPGTPATNG